jgi:hypothetical protein
MMQEEQLIQVTDAQLKQHLVISNAIRLTPAYLNRNLHSTVPK